MNDSGNRRPIFIVPVNEYLYWLSVLRAASFSSSPPNPAVSTLPCAASDAMSESLMFRLPCAAQPLLLLKPRRRISLTHTIADLLPALLLRTPIISTLIWPSDGLPTMLILFLGVSSSYSLYMVVFVTPSALLLRRVLRLVLTSVSLFNGMSIMFSCGHTAVAATVLLPSYEP